MSGIKLCRIPKSFGESYDGEYIAPTTVSDERNKPCPCGSEKKYKSYCGKRLKGT